MLWLNAKKRKTAPERRDLLSMFENRQALSIYKHFWRLIAFPILDKYL